MNELQIGIIISSVLVAGIISIFWMSVLAENKWKITVASVSFIVVFFLYICLLPFYECYMYGMCNGFIFR